MGFLNSSRRKLGLRFGTELPYPDKFPQAQSWAECSPSWASYLIEVRRVLRNLTASEDSDWLIKPLHVRRRIQTFAVRAGDRGKRPPD